MKKEIRVLIADDDPIHVKILRTLLENSGYKVVGTAEDGFRAIEMTKFLVPDVILMDIQMPVLDGIRATHRIQESYPTPVVILSAYRNPEMVEEATKAGAGGYLLKPCDITQVNLAISIAMARFGDMKELARMNKELEEQIRQREQTEIVLRKSQARYEAMVEDQTEAVCRWLSDTTLTFVNKGYCDFLGKTRNELIGRKWMDFVPEASKKAISDLCDTLIANPGIRRHELRSEDAQGNIRWHEWSDCPIFDEQHRLIEFQSVGRDITERKQAEKERERLEAQLMQARKMEAVGQLAGGVAHDFNNLLQVITSYANMVMENLSSDDKSYAAMKEMTNAIEQVTSLVRQLQLLSRQFPPHPEYLDVNELVRDQTKMFELIIRDHITVTFEPGSDVGIIHADSDHIRQILMNLFINAKDSMLGDGSITIKTKNVVVDSDFYDCPPWAEEGKYACITISDTGIGIPYEIQEHIFEPFFSTKDMDKGTGLGFATVYGIVKAHRGILHLDSQLGYGTTVWIYLPVASPASVTDETKKPVSLPKTAETILMAEDDDLVSNAMAKYLKKAGYDVILAGDGAEAIRAFEAQPDKPDFALLDVIMPKATGYEVYEEIVKIRPDMPVIFFTGYDRGMIPLDISPNAPYQIVQKPCSPSDLLKRIRTILDARKK